MKTVLTALSISLFLSIPFAQAESLDGLWRNDRLNISVIIEEENAGIRAKRDDQGIWYRYTRQNNDTYVDKTGNRYEVKGDDEIVWRGARSNKSIIFQRVNDGNGESRWFPWRKKESTGGNDNGRDDDDDERDDDDGDDDDDDDERDRNDRGNRSPRNEGSSGKFPFPWEKNGQSTSDRINESDLTGRWYNRSNKERILIEAANGAYRVRMEKGQWEKYTMDKNDRLRSRSGNIIRMIDRNTLQLRNNRDREEQIFLRQGNGKQHKQHGKSNGKAKGHDKSKHGKKSRG